MQRMREVDVDNSLSEGVREALAGVQLALLAMSPEEVAEKEARVRAMEAAERAYWEKRGRAWNRQKRSGPSTKAWVRGGKGKGYRHWSKVYDE